MKIHVYISLDPDIKNSHTYFKMYIHSLQQATRNAALWNLNNQILINNIVIGGETYYVYVPVEETYFYMSERSFKCRRFIDLYQN